MNTDKLLKKATGGKYSLDYLCQKVSIAIQRGNAACIMGNIPLRLLRGLFYIRERYSKLIAYCDHRIDNEGVPSPANHQQITGNPNVM